MFALALLAGCANLDRETGFTCVASCADHSFECRLQKRDDSVIIEPSYTDTRDEDPL